MPIENIPRILARVKISPPSRPISVFVIEVNGTRQLDALYGDTMSARQRRTATKPIPPVNACPTCGHIPLQPPPQLAEEWLGDFHNNMPLQDVRSFLAKAMET